MKNLGYHLFITVFGLNCLLTYFGFTGDSGPPNELFVHSAYFWLDDDALPADKQVFRETLGTLEQIESVMAMEVGVPAGTPRDIVDNSYDYALLVYFTDQAAHDRYQADTLHLAMMDRFEGLIEQIKVYDAICTR